MKINLKIPDYQRPYRWSTISTNTLFADTYEAFKSKIDEYRLGSVILHKTKKLENQDYEYNLVDGQQRTTTLSILLYALEERNHKLLEEEFKPSSREAILNNYILLQKRINELNDEEKYKYKEYLLKKCTIVKIVTDSEQEAFQFFDSQNSRGKALKPHDLLKSYHLREMTNESTHTKIKLIAKWEDTDQIALEDLFSTYLYPVVRWFKNRDGLNYSSDRIHEFKGIKQSNIYNYAVYHKSSNIMIEQFNSNGSRELVSSQDLNQFQLTQPIIAGKRFFEWTLHYSMLLEKIKDRIENYHRKEEIPDKRTGDIYIKQLYEASLLFFADRFGFSAIDETVMQQLYTWCYSLRLVMNSVYPQTINKYARGQHERINLNLDLFSKMGEMNDPQELKSIFLEKIEEIDIQSNNSKSNYYLMKKWNGW